jgi:hypothetical protein
MLDERAYLTDVTTQLIQFYWAENWMEVGMELLKPFNKHHRKELTLPELRTYLLNIVVKKNAIASNSPSNELDENKQYELYDIIANELIKTSKLLTDNFNEETILNALFDSKAKDFLSLKQYTSFIKLLINTSVLNTNIKASVISPSKNVYYEVNQELINTIFNCYISTENSIEDALENNWDNLISTIIKLIWKEDKTIGYTYLKTKFNFVENHISLDNKYIIYYYLIDMFYVVLINNFDDFITQALITHPFILNPAGVSHQQISPTYKRLDYILFITHTELSALSLWQDNKQTEVQAIICNKLKYKYKCELTLIDWIKLYSAIYAKKVHV